MIFLLALFCGILLAVVPCSGENIKTIDGKEYKDATVIRVEPDGLMISYSRGVLKVPFTELSQDVRESYHYDPQAAATFRQQLDSAEQSRLQAMAVAQQRRAEELPRTPPVVGSPKAPVAPASQPRIAPAASIRDTLSRAQLSEELRSIPSLTLTEYEDQKLRLIGRIVRITFSMRDTDPRELKGGFYESRLRDASISKVRVRFSAEHLPWFTNIVPYLDRASKSLPENRGRHPVSSSVYGRVTKAEDRSHTVVLNLLGTEIYTDFNSSRLIWR